MPFDGRYEDGLSVFFHLDCVFRRCFRRLSALRSGEVNVFHVHQDNRVLAFHRWLPTKVEDVVVVANMRETSWFAYRLGVPRPGRWCEVFNSDVYENWVNPKSMEMAGKSRRSGHPYMDCPAQPR
ncbi:alpha amylase C-terminal domain-containing protein [Paraburkholderia sp. ZP32-5]|uniref:alpha amylase C-terminal domain-containing protein n=1 Tax=Paraburkholderia sp. ZP32-5 TaxID=2883245 RepID=UPI002DD433AE|nr:alpha amylase C-terminal domain-containing protein [Paraburkholderia sp. ZP32-5]